MCWGVKSKAYDKGNIGVTLNPETGECYNEEGIEAYLRLTCTNTRIGRKLFVYIGLAYDDTYTVLIFKAKNNYKCELLHRVKMVYFDELANVIDDVIETRIVEPNMVGK